MGRPLFSSHARAPVVVVAPDHDHDHDHEHASAGAHTHYEKWTYGAFDPDSDEFFEGAVYEAFLGPEDAINVSAADRDRDPEADADSQHEHELDADDLPGGWGRRTRMLSPSERVLRLNELVSRASAIRTHNDPLDPDHPPVTAAEYFSPAAAASTTSTTTSSAGSSAPASPTRRARVHTSDITPIPLPSSVARAHPPPPREQSADTAAAGTGTGTGAAYFLWPFPTAAALPRQPGEPARAHIPAARGPRWPVF